jgi:hypothetical protein
MTQLRKRSFIALLAAVIVFAGAERLGAQSYIYNRANFAFGQGPLGQGPSSVITADFNGDGKQDIAVASTVGNSVSILLGIPGGTFGPAQSFPTGVFPVSLTAADLNGDGKLDLAVTTICNGCAGSPAVSILLGNGDGTFQTHTDYIVGNSPIGIIAADFNGDGKIDLAVANTNDNTVSILIGRGDGSFLPQTAIAVDAAPLWLTSGDFNNDGKIDLITANLGGGTFSILLSNGDGTFARTDIPSGFQTHFGSLSLTVGDFNGDGKLDVVASDAGSQLILLLGNGDGTFSAPSDIPNSTANSSNNFVAAIDFNRDGKLDLAEQGFGGEILVLLGNGDATFQSPVISMVGAGGDASAYATGDMNGDGALDLLACDSNLNTVDVFLGAGDGTFGSAVTLSTSSDIYGPDAAAVADFNGDGKLDLAIALTGFPNGQLAVQLGNGDGTFQDVLTTALTSQAINNADLMLTGDFNGDGKSDLLIEDDYDKGFQVLLGKGDGTFQTPVDTTLTGFNSLGFLAGDLNGDGKTDVAVSTTGTTGNTTLEIYLSNGDGTFTLGAQYANSHASLLADVNQDSKLDIVSIATGSVNVMLGNGDGTFQGAIAVGGPNTGSTVASGDFNGDGKVDLAIGTYEGIAFMAGNGDGTFQAPIYSACGLTTCTGSDPITFQYQGKMIEGDFNGDGKLDLATYPPSDTSEGGMVLLIGNGDGTFQNPMAYQATGTPVSFVVGDFNSDGISDLVIPNQSLITGASVATLFLSGPTLDFFPGQLKFGSQNNGTTSTAQQLKLTNMGPGSLSISDIQVTGAFSETNDCGSTLDKGSNCSVSVTFQPSANGPANGSISFSDAAIASPQTISLFGTGYGPFVTTSPTSLSFGGQVVGTTSSVQAVSLTNKGPGPLTITIQTTGDFTETNNCGSSVAVGEGCAISVSFHPTASGTRSGTLTFTDNAAGSPQSITLSGTGLAAPVLTLSPASLTFTGQLVGASSSAQMVNLSNTGSATLTITALALSGSAAGDFSQTNTCSNAVAAGSNCTINVVFQPTAAGSRSANLTITDNAPDSPQTVQLSGSGTSLGLSTPSGGSTSATVAAGTTATYSLLIGGSGFSGSANLTCTGAPTGVSCMLPSSISLSATSASTLTVTVATTSRTSARLVGGMSSLWAMMVFTCFALPGLPRKTSSISRSLKTILIVFMLLLVSSCGGGTGSTQTNPNGTPAGTYTLTVTATSGAAHQSLPLTLTVK